MVSILRCGSLCPRVKIQLLFSNAFCKAFILFSLPTLRACATPGYRIVFFKGRTGIKPEGLIICFSLKETCELILRGQGTIIIILVSSLTYDVDAHRSDQNYFT